MVNQRKQTSVDIRNLVLKFQSEGKSVRKIAEMVNCPKSTIQDIIQRFKTSKSVENKPKSGRPKLFSHADERWIVQQVKKDPCLSAPKLASEVSQYLGKAVNAETIRSVLRKQNFHGRVARKKPFISKQNKKKRLEFAKMNKIMDLSFWSKVLYSDESKFNIFRSDGRHYVWRKPCTEMKQSHVKATIKHGGGSVMVWGCMSAAGVGNLHFIEGNMDQHQYLRILKQNLAESAEKLGIRDTFQFYQDNDPKHKAQNVRLWLLYNCPHVMETPPQSPDINVIEHLWAHLEDKLKERVIKTKHDLVTALKEEWAKIDPNFCKNLVESMPRRMAAIVNSKGLQTKY